MENTELKMRGTVLFIDPTKDATDKFKVRSFGLDTSVFLNGQTYENYCGLQVAQKHVELLDNVNIGDVVEVSYSIRGQVKEKPEVAGTEKNPRSKQIFTNISAWKIVVLQKAEIIVPSTPETTAPEVADDLPF